MLHNNSTDFQPPALPRRLLICGVVIAVATIAWAIFASSLARSAADSVAIGSWSGTTTYPQSLAGRNMVVRNGFAYVIGGQDVSGTSVSTVRMAAIQSNGTLGSWTGTASLPRSLYLHSVSATDTHVYVVGGWNSTAPPIDRLRHEVFRAPILAGGGLGPWTELSSAFPLSIDLHNSVIVNNRLYVLGGWNGAVPLNTVYFANINSNGISNWIQAAPLPQKLYRMSATTFNGYIYVAGGYDTKNAQATVYFAKVNGDGTLSSWQETTPLPSARYYHQLVVHDGRLVVIAGRSNSSILSDVYSAIPNSNGTIGDWQDEPALPEAIYRFAAASTTLRGSDVIYVVSGLTPGNIHRDKVYHSEAPPSTLPTSTPLPTPTPSPTPLAAVVAQIQNDPTHWVAPGEEISYTIAYRHIGVDSLSNVVIENEIPDNVVIVEGAISDNGVVVESADEGPAVVWTIGTVDPNATGMVSYRVRRIIPEAPNPPLALSILISGPTSAAAGQPIGYTLTMANRVPIDITDIDVTLVLPEGAN